MPKEVWEFLTNPTNREVIAWIGGGLVVLSGGVWAIVKFFATKQKNEPSEATKPRVSSTQGSVAAGGNINKSTINATNKEK